MLGQVKPAPADEPDEWTVEGLEPPSWWHGDEEASMTALQARTV